jgi:hypothetical protein
MSIASVEGEFAHAAHRSFGAPSGCRCLTGGSGNGLPVPGAGNCAWQP